VKIYKKGRSLDRVRMNLIQRNTIFILLFVSALLLGAVIIMNMWSLYEFENTVSDEWNHNQQIKTDFAASKIAEHILQVRNELVSLSTFPTIIDLNINECSGDLSIIHENIEGVLNTLLRTNAQGDVTECSSPRFSSYVGLNVKNTDYFSIPNQTTQPYISSPVQNHDRSQVIVSTPLFKTTTYIPYPNVLGEFKGIIFTIIELGDLYYRYAHPLLDTQESYAFIASKRTNASIFSTLNTSLKNVSASTLEQTVLQTYGESIITRSGFIIGNETFLIFFITPQRALSGNFEAIRTQHTLSLGIVVLFAGVLGALIVYVYRSGKTSEHTLAQAKDLLSTMGITIEKERKTFSNSKITIQKKGVYLVEEETQHEAFELFISMLNKGYAGLGIVRTNPNTIQKKYGLKKTPLVWLTSDQQVENRVSTLDELKQLIHEFIKKSEKSVIFIERLEYLIAHNSFTDVLKMVYTLNDVLTARDAIIILSVNPDSLHQEERKSLEAETKSVYGHASEKIKLKADELAILEYINAQNTRNKSVTYNEITRAFKITKPTTRTKIRALEQKGLIKVQPLGRTKTITITPLGRKLV